MFDWSQGSHGGQWPVGEAHGIVLPGHEALVARRREKIFILTSILQDGSYREIYVCVCVCVCVCVVVVVVVAK